MDGGNGDLSAFYRVADGKFSVPGGTAVFLIFYRSGIKNCQIYSPPGNAIKKYKFTKNGNIEIRGIFLDGGCFLTGKKIFL